MDMSTERKEEEERGAGRYRGKQIDNHTATETGTRSDRQAEKQADRETKGICSVMEENAMFTKQSLKKVANIHGDCSVREVGIYTAMREQNSSVQIEDKNMKWNVKPTITT